jgi:phosphatidylserine decarboxylase
MSSAMPSGISKLCDRLTALPQYLLPKRQVTRWAGSVATSRARWTRRLIPWFIARYGVDMAEAADPDPLHYATFNEFFTRALRPGSRPISAAPLISPVDGQVVQYGRIEGVQLLQAKGHTYSVCALLAGEMGRFFIGSTVVMLFTAGTLQLRTDWTPGRRVRLGEPMVLAA